MARPQAHPYCAPAVPAGSADSTKSASDAAHATNHSANSATLSVANEQKRQKKAVNAGLLVYLLQALHFLFGITAVIGMLVNHTHGPRVKGTVVESHFRWQIVTFWLSAAAYALAFYYWVKSGNSWLVLAVFAVVAYRILRGWWQLVARKPVGTFW